MRGGNFFQQKNKGRQIKHIQKETLDVLAEIHGQVDVDSFAKFEFDEEEDQDEIVAIEDLTSSSGSISPGR